MSLSDLLEKHLEGFGAWCLDSSNKDYVGGKTYRDYVSALRTYGSSLHVPADITGYYAANEVPLSEKVQKSASKLFTYLRLTLPPKERVFNGFPYDDFNDAFSRAKSGKGTKDGLIAHDVTRDEMRDWAGRIPREFHLLFRMLAYSGARVEQLLSFFTEQSKKAGGVAALAEVIEPNDDNGLVAPVFRINAKAAGSGTKRVGYYYFPYELRDEVLGFTGQGITIDRFNPVVQDAAPKRTAKKDGTVEVISAKTLRKWNTNLMIKSGVPVEIAGWLEGRTPQSVTWKNYADLDGFTAKEYSRMQGVLLKALPADWFGDIAPVEKPKPKKSRAGVNATPADKWKREKEEILKLLSEGKTNEEIVAKMHIGKAKIKRAKIEAGIYKGGK